MSGRVHQNDAPALSLASDLAAGATTIPVNQSITDVETPISYVINSGGANEEIVTLVDKNTGTSPSQFENCIRGCDGTSDQSHSSGEVLTHEATARDFVDKNIIQSQNFSPSPRIYHEDWTRGRFKDRWTVQNGSPSLVDGKLSMPPGTIITFDEWTQLGDAGVHLEAMFYKTNRDSGGGPGIMLTYQDADNKAWYELQRSRFSLKEESGGSVTELQSVTSSQMCGTGQPVKMTHHSNNMFGDTFNKMRASAFPLFNDLTGSVDTTIANNSIGWGLINTDSNYAACEYVHLVTNS